MDSSDDDDFRKELEGTLPFGRGVRVLAADAVGLFALEKPAGTMTHPNAAGTAKKSLFAADYSLRDECYSCRVPGGKIRKVFVLNRLDSPTSGVVLAATARPSRERCCGSSRARGARISFACSARRAESRFSETRPTAISA